MINRTPHIGESSVPQQSRPITVIDFYRAGLGFIIFQVVPDVFVVGEKDVVISVE
ncbi:hypothetical protein D3C84_1037960 [compost metagenome]